MSKKVKIGFPKYINTLPLLHYLETDKCGVEIVSAPPRTLNKMLRLGELHASLSSSIVYAREFEKYVLLPDISISAVGKVRSVILFHKEELKELSGKHIAITPETESSFLLLKVLLEEFVGVKPQYIRVNKGWKNLDLEEKEKFSGYLAIGDEALFLVGGDLSEYFITDLAKLWLDFTGLPFVFALLIVRKDGIEEFRETLKLFCRHLYLARAKAFENLEALLKEASYTLPSDTVRHYLSCLEYDFSFLKQKAFLKFCKFLIKKSDISTFPELTFLSI